MMRFLVRCTLVVAVLGGLGASPVFASRPQYPPQPHHEMASSWDVTPNADGSLTMRMQARFGAIDRNITMNVSRDVIPTGGTARFPNGFERQLREGELRYFWTDVGGAPAAWQHLHRTGALTTVKPGQDRIPSTWNQKWIVVVPQNGKWFVGRLLPGANEQEIQLSVNNMGLPQTTALKPIIFEISQIKEMHAR